MAAPNKLRDVEAQHGDLERVIPETVNRLGSQKAAAEALGVSESTINKWLKEHGYIVQQQVIKEEAEQA